MKHAFFLSTLFLLNSHIGFSCTTVFWNNNEEAKVVARTVDLFASDHPKIKVLPRGIEHHGATGDHALNWKSRYGSVVVSEFNSDAVSDGINEQSLSVHLLYLTGTDYEVKADSYPKLSNTLWAQYLLDNFKTVDEALRAMDTFQLVATEVFNQKWPLHLSMQDASGDAAVVEYIKGKKVVYHGHQYTVMTNEPAYNIQLNNLKRYQAFGGALPLPGDSDPLSRFVRAATYLKTLPAPKNPRDTLAGIFSVIRTTMVPFGAVDTSGNKTVDAWPTRWVSVADLTHKTYYFNSTITPNIIWLDLNRLDFSAGKPILSLDPNDLNLLGNVQSFLK